MLFCFSAALYKITCIHTHTGVHWYTCWLVHLSLMTVFNALFEGKLWTCGTCFLLLPGLPEKDPIWINHCLPGVPVVLWMSPLMINAVISVCGMDCKQWRIVKANASSVVRGKSFTFLSQSIKLVRRRICWCCRLQQSLCAQIVDLLNVGTFNFLKIDYIVLWQ